jgi:hypothetical protein
MGFAERKIPHMGDIGQCFKPLPTFDQLYKTMLATKGVP